MKRARTLIVIVLLAVAGSASASTYTLRWGDNLTVVARRFGVSVAGLAAANGITNPDRVWEGRSLVIPGAAPAAAPAATTHEVSWGENLTKIARRYGTTVAAIAAANGISDADHVAAGRRLTIPGAGGSPGPAPVLIAHVRDIPGRCPVEGAGYWDISDSFSAPRPEGRSHAGNDIFAGRGTPVVANVGGTLRHVQGSRAGNAYYLAGDDGHLYYGAHLDGYVASPGRVEAGAVIGRVGSTGNAATTPPHLHFEIKPGGGESVDPYATLRRWCRG